MGIMSFVENTCKQAKTRVIQAKTRAAKLFSSIKLPLLKKRAELIATLRKPASGLVHRLHELNKLRVPRIHPERREKLKADIATAKHMKVIKWKVSPKTPTKHKPSHSKPHHKPSPVAKKIIQAQAAKKAAEQKKKEDEASTVTIVLRESQERREELKQEVNKLQLNRDHHEGVANTLMARARSARLMPGRAHTEAHRALVADARENKKLADAETEKITELKSKLPY